MSRSEMGEIPTKQEGGSSTSDTNNNNNKIFSTPSSWSRSKDPRIVQVSRAFGGKDRHTKVCTVRGLRDRRVRLSVATAIQLYDLNQPSKVIDWLLNAAKNEIDELPPLQIPPGFCFPQNLEYSTNNNNRSKEMVEEEDEEEGRESSECLEDLMNNGNNNNNNSMTYNSFTRWDNNASNLLSLSHASQPAEDHQYHNFGTINYMPTGLLLSQQYSSQGLLVHQSYLSSNNDGSVEDLEGNNKHNIGLQIGSSNSLHHQQSSHHQQHIRPFHFSMMANRSSEPNQESEYDNSR